MARAVILSSCLASAAVLAQAQATYTYAPVTEQMRADANAIISAALAPGVTTVWDRLAYVCDTFGPRFSGSKALEDAIDSIVSTAAADGLNVYTEPVTVPVWVRGQEWAKMVSPRNKTLHMVGLGGSIGTGGGVITAPVLVVSSEDDLKSRGAEAVGKIILFNVPFTTYSATVRYRSQGASMAAAAGGVAALVRSVGPYGIQTPHTGGSQPSTVPTAAVSMEDATQMQRMQDRNQTVIVSLYMEAHTLPDAQSRNIIMEITGADKPNEYVVFGGHIDSWDIAEGAMDDGGGSFSSWEALRLILSLGIRPSRTIRAVMWVNEENGGTGGATYAADHKAELNVTSIAIESDEGSFTPYSLAFTGHGAAMNQLIILSELLAPIGAGNVTGGGGGTDIGPMCATGVPCAGLEVLDPRIGNYANNPCLGFSTAIPPGTDVAGSISPGYFWFHHTEGDTMDRLDPAQLQTVAASLAIWVTAIANLPELLPRSGDVPPLPNNTKPSPQLSGPAIGGIVAGALVLIGGIVALVYFRTAACASLQRTKSFVRTARPERMGAAYESMSQRLAPGPGQLYAGEISGAYTA